MSQYKNLVKEAGALFGSRHYRGYHFLFTLSDHVAHFGLEHHESSDDRYGERTLIDPEPQKAFGVPAAARVRAFLEWQVPPSRGLISGGHDGGYDTPMKGDLLWVYEGLTEYLGEVLTPRSGLWSAGGLSRVTGRHRRRTRHQVSAAPGVRWKIRPSPRRFCTTPATTMRATAAAWTTIPRAR